MGERSASDILLTGFDQADLPAIRDAIGALGPKGRPGRRHQRHGLRPRAGGGLRRDLPPGPARGRPRRSTALVLLRAGLRSRPGRGGLLRARGPHAPHAARGRELKRLLSVLTEDARERKRRRRGVLGPPEPRGRNSRGRPRPSTSAASAGAWPASSPSPASTPTARARTSAPSPSRRPSSIPWSTATSRSTPRSSPTKPSTRTATRPSATSACPTPPTGTSSYASPLTIEDGRAELVLEDQGAGFDTTKVDEGPSGLDVSGKGFWLIKRPFDAATYNAKGNSLTLSNSVIAKTRNMEVVWISATRR